MRPTPFEQPATEPTSDYKVAGLAPALRCQPELFDFESA
jgi:hypothetical protein